MSECKKINTLEPANNTPKAMTTDVSFVSFCLRKVLHGKVFDSVQDVERELLKLDEGNSFRIFENGDRSVSCALQPFVAATCRTGRLYKRAKGGEKRDQHGVYVLPVEDTGKVIVAAV